MRRSLFTSLTVCAALFAGTALHAQQQAAAPAPPPAPPFGTPVTLDQAARIAQAAIAEAKRMNVPMAIAISEPSGDLVYFGRMENAPYSAIQLAQHKATTSARFRRPSRAFQEQLAAGTTFFLTFGVAAAAGGLPIVHAGKLIGSIGVSGGSGAQDEQVGRAGLAALN
jgi:uncharacterized protein GlcG (DUF336 family)